VTIAASGLLPENQANVWNATGIGAKRLMKVSGTDAIMMLPMERKMNVMGLERRND